MTEPLSAVADDPFSDCVLLTLRHAQDLELPLHERVLALDELRDWQRNGDLNGLAPEMRAAVLACIENAPAAMTRTRAPRNLRGRPVAMLDDEHTATVAAYFLACKLAPSVERAREATCAALGVSDRSIDRWRTAYRPMLDLHADQLASLAGASWLAVHKHLNRL